MTLSTSEEKKKEAFIISTLKMSLFFYLFLSLFRFFIHGDSILSKDPIVILIALSIAVCEKVYTWLNSLLTIDTNKKSYRYFINPIKNAVIAYIILSLIHYAVWRESLLANNIEVISFSIMVGIIKFAEAKIDDLSPRDPDKEPSRPLKYYIDKFIINASPFHKTMFFVYGFCIALLIFIFIRMQYK